jgi:hypothetical protein
MLYNEELLSYSCQYTVMRLWFQINAVKYHDLFRRQIKFQLYLKIVCVLVFSPEFTSASLQNIFELMSLLHFRLCQVIKYFWKQLLVNMTRFALKSHLIDVTMQYEICIDVQSHDCNKIWLTNQDSKGSYIGIWGFSILISELFRQCVVFCFSFCLEHMLNLHLFYYLRHIILYKGHMTYQTQW